MSLWLLFSSWADIKLMWSFTTAAIDHFMLMLRLLTMLENVNSSIGVCFLSDLKVLLVFLTDLQILQCYSWDYLEFIILLYLADGFFSQRNDSFLATFYGNDKRCPLTTGLPCWLQFGVLHHLISLVFI